MLAYSLLLGARNIFGFRVFLQEEVLQILKHYFPHANEVRVRMFDALCFAKISFTD